MAGGIEFCNGRTVVVQQDVPVCKNNKLTIQDEPKLERLTRLENCLIARDIHFMFIHEKPVSRMWCQTGKVTLVPIEEEAVKATVEAPKRLPRTPQEGGLVTIRLKKKLEYQATVGRPELVNVKHLEEALRTLQLQALTSTRYPTRPELFFC